MKKRITFYYKKINIVTVNENRRFVGLLKELSDDVLQNTGYQMEKDYNIDGRVTPLGVYDYRVTSHDARIEEEVMNYIQNHYEIVCEEENKEKEKLNMMNINESAEIISVTHNGKIDDVINEKLAQFLESVAKLYGAKLHIKDTDWQCVYDLKGEMFSQLESLGVRVNLE